MKLKVAHLRTQGIDFLVADADARTRLENDRNILLSRIVVIARRSGLKVDKGALAFTEGGRTVYFGTPDLVNFLARQGVPRWTHTLEV
jgi:hypothetical protein